jgi:hypothetical protein
VSSSKQELYPPHIRETYKPVYIDHLQSDIIYVTKDLKWTAALLVNRMILLARNSTRAERAERGRTQVNRESARTVAVVSSAHGEERAEGG